MQLDPGITEALTGIVRFLERENIRYVVFGALCPMILIDAKDPGGRGFGARETKDVDMLVEVDDWNHYHRILDMLEENGFKRTGTEHRLTWKGRQVDLIPYGKSLIDEDRLVWPESGNRMDVSGFEAIFEKAETVLLPDTDGLQVRMIPLPLSLYTKVIAYLDRQFPRDLLDITHILLHYEEIGFSERRYNEEIPADMEYEMRGAYLLGYDLKSLLSREKRARMAPFFELAEQEYLPAVRESLMFYRLSEAEWRHLIRTLRKGMD